MAADCVSCFVCAFDCLLDLGGCLGTNELCCVACRPAAAHGSSVGGAGELGVLGKPYKQWLALFHIARSRRKLCPQ